MRHFEGTKEFPNLKESTICGWKDECNKTKKRGPCQPESSYQLSDEDDPC